MGYCGFEGRHYSLFHSIENDMGFAVNLQVLIQAIAYKLIAEGQVTHQDIPDTPEIESERRQIFFTAAVDLKKFSIKQDSKNVFLGKLLEFADKIKKSRRNKGFNVIKLQDYRIALLRFLQTEGREIITDMGLQDTINDLEARLTGDQAVSSRLIKDIMKNERSPDPIRMTGKRFNRNAEEYYRSDLRAQHLSEAMASVIHKLSQLNNEESALLETQLNLQTTLALWLEQVKQHLAADTLNSEQIRQLIALIIYLDCDLSAHTLNQKNQEFMQAC